MSEKFTDCCFSDAENWFRLRAAAIIIEEGNVLFIGNDKDDYLYSIGGGIHLNEKAEDAVVREVFEEMGVHYEIERLAVIHENFFLGSGPPFLDKKCHEVAFYFLMKPKGFITTESDSISSTGAKEYLKWIPIEELGNEKSYPTFLKSYLENIPSTTIHIISDETKTSN